MDRPVPMTGSGRLALSLAMLALGDRLTDWSAYSLWRYIVGETDDVDAAAIIVGTAYNPTMTQADLDAMREEGTDLLDPACIGMLETIMDDVDGIVCRHCAMDHRRGRADGPQWDRNAVIQASDLLTQAEKDSLLTQEDLDAMKADDDVFGLDDNAERPEWDDPL